MDSKRALIKAKTFSAAISNRLWPWGQRSLRCIAPNHSHEHWLLRELHAHVGQQGHTVALLPSRIAGCGGRVGAAEGLQKSLAAKRC